MRRSLLLSCCFLSLLFALLIQSLTVEGQRNANLPVVLISIDGMKPDYVLEADKHNLKIPNLRRFLKEGSYATNVRRLMATSAKFARLRKSSAAGAALSALCLTTASCR